MTRSLLELSDWLFELGVTRVVMEATADYWRAPFYVLEDRFETWLVNAKHVKHLPGRPKTDRLDAVWLCKVAERQMLRPSFVPPPALRQRSSPSGAFPFVPQQHWPIRSDPQIPRPGRHPLFRRRRLLPAPTGSWPA